MISPITPSLPMHSIPTTPSRGARGSLAGRSVSPEPTPTKPLLQPTPPRPPAPYVPPSQLTPPKPPQPYDPSNAKAARARRPLFTNPLLPSNPSPLSNSSETLSPEGRSPSLPSPSNSAPTTLLVNLDDGMREISSSESEKEEVSDAVVSEPLTAEGLEKHLTQDPELTAFLRKQYAYKGEDLAEFLTRKGRPLEEMPSPQGEVVRNESTRVAYYEEYPCQTTVSDTLTHCLVPKNGAWHSFWFDYTPYEFVSYMEAQGVAWYGAVKDHLLTRYDQELEMRQDEPRQEGATLFLGINIPFKDFTLYCVVTRESHNRPLFAFFDSKEARDDLFADL